MALLTPPPVPKGKLLDRNTVQPSTTDIEQVFSAIPPGCFKDAIGPRDKAGLSRGIPASVCHQNHPRPYSLDGHVCVVQGLVK